MSYRVDKKGRGEKPYKVTRVSDGKVVAESATKSKALKHIGHRVDAESRKNAS